MNNRSWIVDLAGLVTIVGTIIGANWVSNNIMSARIDALEIRIDGLEKSMNARIDGLEGTMNARIDGLEGTMDVRIGGLDKRIGVMESSLSDLRDDIRELWAALYRVIANQVAQLGNGLEGGDTVIPPPPERGEE